MKLSKRKLKVIMLKFVRALKEEAEETKEMALLIEKSRKGEKLTKEENKKIRRQFYDILKGIGIGIPFIIIPGATVLLGMALVYAKKKNISLLPSAFEKTL